jgi:hypothetical protein
MRMVCTISYGIGVSSKGERVQIDLKKLKAALCE